MSLILQEVPGGGSYGLPQPVTSVTGFAMTHCTECGKRDDVGIGPYGTVCRGGRPCPPGPGNAKPCRAGPVCPAGGRGKNPPVTASPCQPPLGKGAEGVRMSLLRDKKAPPGRRGFGVSRWRYCVCRRNMLWYPLHPPCPWRRRLLRGSRSGPTPAGGPGCGYTGD